MPLPLTVSVSIVTFRSNLPELKETIDSLLASFNLSNKNQSQLTQLFIIDNNSGTSYQSKLRTLINSYNIDICLDIQNTNLGFGKGHNSVLTKINSDLHLVLNPDIIFQNQTLQNALEVVNATPSLGLVVPTIHNEHGEEQNLHGNKPTVADLILRSIAPSWVKKLFARKLSKLYSLPSNETITHITPAFFSGCCMLFRTKTFKTLNGFTDKYFLYFEDYDLSLRLLQKSNAIISKEFKVIHKGGNTKSKNLFHWYCYIKSMLIFFMDH